MARTINLPKEEQNKVRKVKRSFLKSLMRHNNKEAKEKVIKPIQIPQMQKSLRIENIQCPICLEILIEPAVTECGHAYCLTCIELCFLRSAQRDQKFTCSICRNSLELYECNTSQPLQAAIGFFLKFMANFMQVKGYIDRKREFQRIQAKRAVKELAIGEKIDYFDDKSKKWRHGVIIDSFLNQEIDFVVKIQTLQKHGGKKPVVFRADTRKIAKKAYYTSKQENK